jgi:DNA-binding transcriptional regulator YdaS (Cro superfamily)
MNLSTWLDKETGRAAAMAAHFGVSQAAIHHWRTKGVPVGRMKAVRDHTKEAVSLDEMVPDSTPEQAGQGA